MVGNYSQTTNDNSDTPDRPRFAQATTLWPLLSCPRHPVCLDVRHALSLLMFPFLFPEFVALQSHYHDDVQQHRITTTIMITTIMMMMMQIAGVVKPRGINVNAVPSKGTFKSSICLSEGALPTTQSTYGQVHGASMPQLMLAVRTVAQQHAEVTHSPHISCKWEAWADHALAFAVASWHSLLLLTLCGLSAFKSTTVVVVLFCHLRTGHVVSPEALHDGNMTLPACEAASLPVGELYTIYGRCHHLHSSAYRCT